MIATPEEFAPEGINRRTFLAAGTGLIGAFIGLTVGIPIVAYVVAPSLRKGAAAAWTPLGSLTDFKADEPTRVEFTMTKRDGWVERSEKKAVWVVAHGGGDVTVFNPRCTHLGCAVDWKPDAKEFQSPCHGGRFALNGKVLGGPPPRPLDTLEARVEQGQLSVQYRDFKLGVPGKSEV